MRTGQVPLGQPLNPAANYGTPYSYGEPIAPVYGTPLATGGSYYRDGMAMNVAMGDPYYPNNVAATNMMILTEE